MEEEIAVAERAARKKANSKSGKKKADEEGDDPVVMDLLSDDEEPAAPKLEDTDDSKLTKEQLKRKRAEERKAVAEEKKRQKMEEQATKAAVRICLARNNKAMKLATASSPQLVHAMEEQGTITAVEKDTAADLMTLMREWKHACTNLLEKYSKDPGDDMELPFDSAKMLQEKLKAAKNLVAQLKKNR